MKPLLEHLPAGSLILDNRDPAAELRLITQITTSRTMLDTHSFIRTKMCPGNLRKIVNSYTHACRTYLLNEGLVFIVLWREIILWLVRWIDTNTHIICLFSESSERRKERSAKPKWISVLSSVIYNFNISWVVKVILIEMTRIFKGKQQILAF